MRGSREFKPLSEKDVLSEQQPENQRMMIAHIDEEIGKSVKSKSIPEAQEESEEEQDDDDDLGDIAGDYDLEEDPEEEMEPSEESSDEPTIELPSIRAVQADRDCATRLFMIENT